MAIRLRLGGTLVTMAMWGLLASVLCAEDDWIVLFNGKNLNNWVQKNGTATFRVEDNQIVGRTSEGSPNSFLCTKEEYDDFELTFEVKVDDELNSGIQMRSHSRPDRDRGRVHGPQVEIATNGTAGFIYGEALGTGWLTPPTPHSWFKKGEWNVYRVVAQGDTIRTWLNGQPIAELVDNRTGMSRGFIGLQVHSIPPGRGPYEVRWRNIRIRPLR